MITEDEYKRTHPHVKEIHKKETVGIDIGVKSALVLSDGIAIESPKPLKKTPKKSKIFTLTTILYTIRQKK